MKIVYGVCVGSWEKLQANVIPHIGDRPLIAMWGQRSIAEAYNAIMEAAYELGADVLILQHDDLEITDPDGEAKLVAALQDQIVLVGVAGGMSQGGIAWWNYTPVGHQQTDVRYIDFGNRSGPVDLLEGSLLAIAGHMMLGFRFDTNYPGFHGYDVDISRQVRDMDLEVAVVDVDTHHHTQMGFKSAESHQDWLKADELFRAKWELV